MRRPYLLFLVSFFAFDAAAADPDVFPVEDQPPIGVESHDDTNRRVVEPPPDRMVFSALEFTAPDPEPTPAPVDQANRQASTAPTGDVANQAASKTPAPAPAPQPVSAPVGAPPGDSANAKAATAPVPGDDRNRAAVPGPATMDLPPPYVQAPDAPSPDQKNGTPSVGPGLAVGAAVVGTATAGPGPAAAPLDVPAPPEVAGEPEEAAEEPALIAEEGEVEGAADGSAEEKKGFGGWVKGAAHDVGAAFTGAWVAVTGQKKRAEKRALEEAEALEADAEGTEEAVEAGSESASIWAGAFEEGPDPLEAEAAPEPATIGPERLATSAAPEERPLAIPAGEPPPPAAASDTPRTVAAEVEIEPEVEVAEHEAREDHEHRWRFEQRTLTGVRRRSGRFGAFLGWNGLRTGYGHDGTNAWGLEAGITLGPVILGAAGYGTGAFVANNHDLRFAYGGFQPGIILWSGKIVHPRLDVLIGGGTAFEADTGRTLGAASVVAPRLGVELNVTRAIRLSGNLGYRFVGAPDAAVRGDFSGFEGGLSVRFGWL